MPVGGGIPRVNRALRVRSGWLQHPLGPPTRGTDSRQPAFSLVSSALQGRHGLGAHGPIEQPRAPIAARRTGGAFLAFLLPARGTRWRKHFVRTGPQIDDKNVTETEATHRPPPFRRWRPFNLQWPGQLCTRSLRVGVLVSRLHQDQCTNGSVFVFGRTPNNNSRIQLAEAFPARFCLSGK